MRSLKPNFPRACSLLAMLALIIPVHSAVLINEDFQTANDVGTNLGPILPNGTRLDNSNAFTGWDFSGLSGNQAVSRRSNNQTDFTGSTSLPNQGIQFEWGNQYITYDTGHNWSSADVFSLSLNATEMNWGNANNRAVLLRLTETGTSNTLWSTYVELPEYDVNHNAGDDWSAAQTFNLNILASNFVGGTEGSGITFGIAGSDGNKTNAQFTETVSDISTGRGTYVDNINLTLVPEPSAAVLLGCLASMMLLVKRRRSV